MIKIFILFIFVVLSLYGQSAGKIIKQVEDNLNGKTAELQITMTVHTQKTQRTMKLQSFSIGKTKSFMKILYPKKDEGITFLKVDNKMWQYVPKIERIIKIPASMMLQSWMGSDFTNDDLVKESSISDDYDSKILQDEKDKYIIELLPKEEATVVWGKVIMEVSKEYYLPTKVDYYDEDDILVRILYYQDIKKFDKRYYPTYWEIIPQTEDKQGRKTVMKVEDALFDKDISESYFTKRALKRYSR